MRSSFAFKSRFQATTTPLCSLPTFFRRKDMTVEMIAWWFGSPLIGSGQNQPQQRYFITETGFLNTKVFCFGCERVCGCLECGASQRFECFLVCDNMTIHTNKDIVNAAARRRAYMYNMMPTPHTGCKCMAKNRLQF